MRSGITRRVSLTRVTFRLSYRVSPCNVRYRSSDTPLSPTSSRPGWLLRCGRYRITGSQSTQNPRGTQKPIYIPVFPHHTGWFRLNAQNCVPGNSSRRFFELDHEILHTYSGRQYLKLEEVFFFYLGFRCRDIRVLTPPRVKYSSRDPE